MATKKSTGDKKASGAKKAPAQTKTTAQVKATAKPKAQVKTAAQVRPTAKARAGTQTFSSTSSGKSAPASTKAAAGGTLDRVDAAAGNWRRIVSMAWEDAGFKDQLIKNPKKVLAANGVKVSASLEYIVHTDSPTTKNFVLPYQGKHHGADGQLDAAGDDDPDGDPAF